MSGRQTTLGADIEQAIASAERLGDQVSAVLAHGDAIYIASYLVGVAGARGDLTKAREAEILALLTATTRVPLFSQPALAASATGVASA